MLSVIGDNFGKARNTIAEAIFVKSDFLIAPSHDNFIVLSFSYHKIKYFIPAHRPDFHNFSY